MKKIWNYIKLKPSDLIGIVTAVALFFGIQAWQTRNLVEKNRPAPEFKLASVEGKQINLSDYRGKNVVLYFFAPWCTVCKATTGNLGYLKSLRGEDSVKIIGIGLAYSDPSEIAEYKKNHEMDLPVLIGNDEVMSEYKIKGFPTVYFLNKEGKVTGSSLGYISTIGLFLRSL